MANIRLIDDTPMDIDPNEVLREYGLDDAVHTSTVVQQEDGNTVTIPESTPLAPPPIDNSDNSDIEDDLDALANEMLNASSVSSNVLEQDSGEPPVDLDEEEDNDDLDDPIPWSDPIESARSAEIVSTPAEETARDDVNEVNVTTLLDTQEPIDEGGSVVNEQTFKPLTVEDAINLLPVNSLSYASGETTSRFSGAMWFNAIQLSTVVLAGLGGIGSYVLFCLSRMKPKQIFLYDDDEVELANLSGQLYSVSMVGKKKVDAMAELARDFSCYYGVQAVPQRFTKDTPAGDIMICGFDNMQARKDFFESWVKHLVNHPSPHRCLFIDGRLNMEEFQVFCMRGNDTYSIDRYNKEYLFEDYQAESVQCSMKQTAYCANMIGSVMVNLFTNFVANLQKPLVDRDLPFKTYYDASMMYFKTEV